MNPSREADYGGSSGRLANMALALSAAIGYLGASGVVPLFVPTAWLLKPYAAPEAMLSPLVQLAARIGINLWLPAAVLIVVFCLMGLHRRAAMPEARWPGVVFATSWGVSVGLTVLMIVVRQVQGAGLLLLLIGTVLTPLYLGLSFATIAAAVVEIRSRLRDSAPAPPRLPLGLLACAVLPPALSVLPLLFAPTGPSAAGAVATQDAAAWNAACSTIGVRLLARPAGPVKSLARDWDPAQGKPEVRLELDAAGRVRMRGGAPVPRDPESARRHPFEFIEERPGHFTRGRAAQNPDAPWYRFDPSHTTYYGVDELSADVLATYRTETVAGSTDPARPWRRHTITLTDRRSGEILGDMVYVLDGEDWGRACGANTDTAISELAFFHDAINR